MATITLRKRRAKAWAIQTREIVFMAIGAALYGVLGWATALLRIPGPFNSQIRPAVIIPMFFGAIFGPWVGFFTGLVGNIIIDLLSGYGFSWNWSLGNGLLGLIAGFAYIFAEQEELPKLSHVMGWSFVGIVFAFLLASLGDILTGLSLMFTLVQWGQVVVLNFIPWLILLPML